MFSQRIDDKTLVDNDYPKLNILTQVWKIHDKNVHIHKNLFFIICSFVLFFTGTCSSIDFHASEKTSRTHLLIHS